MTHLKKLIFNINIYRYGRRRRRSVLEWRIQNHKAQSSTKK